MSVLPVVSNRSVWVVTWLAQSLATFSWPPAPYSCVHYLTLLHCSSHSQLLSTSQAENFGGFRAIWRYPRSPWSSWPWLVPSPLSDSLKLYSVLSSWQSPFAGHFLAKWSSPFLSTAMLSSFFHFEVPLANEPPHQLWIHSVWVCLAAVVHFDSTLQFWTLVRPPFHSR